MFFVHACMHAYICVYVCCALVIQFTEKYMCARYNNFDVPMCKLVYVYLHASKLLSSTTCSY